MLVIFIKFCFFVYADLKITKISVTDNKLFNVILNDDIQILNIILKDNNVVFPVYNSKGKTYRQFSILRKEFRQYLIDSLSKSKTSPKTDATKVKINKLSLVRKHKTIKAFASVIFNDDIEVECRIMQTNGRLWIAWPANKKDDIWIKEFKFINENLKRDLEKKLITDYTSNK
jgi:DNA-binding cell septation regulator SpoVG